MIALSFRIKLLLAMMLLVAVVTGATLYVVQQKVRTTYLKLFQDQFESEVNYFASQQDARIGNFKGPCETVAQSEVLRKSLKQGETDRVYETVLNGLSGVPNLRGQRAQARAGGATAAETAGLRAGTFIRVLDVKGNILPSPDAKGGASQRTARKRLEVQLAAVHEAMDKLEAQQIGFLSRELPNGKTNLLEVIVTKIADPDSRQTAGALVLGTPFLDTSENEMKRMSQIQSGIWLENQVYSQTIPAGVREELSRRLAAQINQDGQPGNTFNITLAGTPERAFFKLLNPNSPFPPAYHVSLYSLAGAHQTQHELRLQILGFSLAAILCALVLSLLISHGLSTPLRELVAGTAAVRRGELQVRVPVRSRDEVGELASSFNEMAEGLAQKEMYRTVLNMVADEKVAQALVNGQLALGGELREISVLFCDIRGFTALTENMPPEEVIEMLNEHMTALTRVVKEHNGVLDKFAGDLLMAIFGAPVSHENDTLNAARCALRLKQEREKLNTTSRHQLRIGIGIATGKVVAGCMGSADRLNYTVLGERVNLASRLCGQAEAGQVVIDQTTREKLGDAISVTPLSAFNLKGFRENVVAYELTEVHSWELDAE
ncbi:MAG TPA: adenylate/guanylate cyclase domain-containing protein [Verrucomicrobiae bacterium]|nr:adenylate/guanylate cyclase domain-containing protein [Verrucomicrobiae bacterium]